MPQKRVIEALREDVLRMLLGPSRLPMKPRKGLSQTTTFVRMKMLAIRLVIEFVICQARMQYDLRRSKQVLYEKPCPEPLPIFRASCDPYRNENQSGVARRESIDLIRVARVSKNYRYEQGIRTRWQTFAGPSTEWETGRSKVRSRPRQLDCTPRRRVAYPTGSLVRNRECQRNPATRKASWHKIMKIECMILCM